MSTPKIKHESYALLGGQNSKVSPYGQGPHEFRGLVNVNFVTPGALTKMPGTSLYTGATISGQITGGVEFERLNGASFIVVTANTNAYQATPNTFTAFKTGLKNNALFDFVTFVDRLFACNGHDFFKYDGTNSTAYSLPNGITAAWGVTANGAAAGPYFTPGTYVFGYGYVNDRGYIGPASNGITVVLGASIAAVGYYGLTAPSGYGISAIQLWRSSATSADLFGTTQIAASAVGATDTAWPLTTRPAKDYRHFTLAPRFMEIFNNQLFMGGFSSVLSTVHWSDIGEPEGVLPEYNAEFRTNDGDRVTGMKAYNGALVVTKENSCHKVIGDNPTNFAIQEISDQYGCLSNRAMVVYEDLLWFLDSKGIVEYNGANVRIVSNPVEDVFRTMNVSAARDKAIAIHKRDENEVWFGIPCNGATQNNCTVVYDYNTSAWTTREGFNPALFMSAKGALERKSTFYGGYNGDLYYFSASLMSDYGRAMTCMIGTHFLASEGQTSEAMYRRFWLNLEPISGVTQAIEARFKKNYEESYALTRTMYQAPFQSRVDFGISARSISAELLHVSASLPFKVYGFTFESRHLRGT